MGTRAFAAALCMVAAGCSDAEQKAMDKQRALEQARQERKEARALYEKAASAAKAPEVPLDKFWVSSEYTRLKADGACPEGIWALFPGAAPGADPAEKKANEARRAELSQKLKAATYAVQLLPPEGIQLGEYDAPKGVYPIQVAGSIDCTDSFGHLTLAWNSAKAVTPGNSAAKEGAEVQQSIWEASPTRVTLPMKSVEEAKTFAEQHRFDLAARVVFKLGRTEVHRKMFRTSKVEAAGIAMGGGNEDWGAGRLVHVELAGMRVATEREQRVISETRK